jgi:hypothetical protein
MLRERTINESHSGDPALVPSGIAPATPPAARVTAHMTQNSKKGFFQRGFGRLLGLLLPRPAQPAFFVDGIAVLINRRCFSLHRFIADAAGWTSQFVYKFQECSHWGSLRKGIIGLHKGPGAEGHGGGMCKGTARSLASSGQKCCAHFLGRAIIAMMAQDSIEELTPADLGDLRECIEQRLVFVTNRGPCGCGGMSRWNGASGMT